MGTSKHRHGPRRLVRFWKYIGVAAFGTLLVVIAAFALQSTQTTASESPDPMFTSQPTPTEEPTQRAPLAEVQAFVRDAKPLVVSVLGDSTSDSENEWVFLWAQHLADQGATVTVHTWDPAIRTYPEPQILGDGARSIEIWNGSIPGQNADAALDLVDSLQPVAPSLLILNYGHNHGKNPVGEAMENLAVSTDERWSISAPVVAMLQNPALGAHADRSQEGRDSVVAWADEHGIPTVDATSAFLANPNWETEYMRDDVHPNSAGYLVWGEKVIRTLG